jgi:CHAD domain-containing protein
LKDEARGLVRAWLDKTLDELSHLDEDRDSRIHASRTGLKRVRSFLRLVRPGLAHARFHHENVCFRDAARLLSEARNAAVVVECLDRVLTRAGVDRAQFAGERQWLEELSKVALESSERRGSAEVARTMLQQARQRVPAWTSDLTDWSIIHRGFAFTYKRARRAFDNVGKDPAAERLHEWRKATKQHLYQLQMIRPLWPGKLRPRIQQTKALGNLLGDYNDLDLLQNTLLRTGKRATLTQAAAPQFPHLEQLIQLIERNSDELRRDAMLLGEELYATRSRDLEAKLQKQLKGK